MKLIAGLGNPGPEYRRTLHNIGFMALDLFLERRGLKVSKKKHQGLCVSSDESDLWFVKPQTFMNNSGDCIAPFAENIGAEPSEILIVHDEADFEPGRLQLRKGGSSGGHNGLESIISSLGSNDFWRLRVGIGKDPTMSLSDYVLAPVPETVFASIRDRAADALEKIVELGPEKAIHTVNAPS